MITGSAQPNPNGLPAEFDMRCVVDQRLHRYAIGVYRLPSGAAARFGPFRLLVGHDVYRRIALSLSLRHGGLGTLDELADRLAKYWQQRHLEWRMHPGRQPVFVVKWEHRVPDPVDD